ncbi:MAG: hypothetical protein ACK4SA_10060, partial [Caldilinea sp.]
MGEFALIQSAEICPVRVIGVQFQLAERLLRKFPDTTTPIFSDRQGKQILLSSREEFHLSTVRGNGSARH